MHCGVEKVFATPMQQFNALPACHFVSVCCYYIVAIFPIELLQNTYVPKYAALHMTYHVHSLLECVSLFDY